MSFGERIKFRRGELKLSRGELAGRLGVSPSAVSNYENGLSFPKEDVMLRLFDSLETDPNQLFRDSFRGGGQALSSEEQTLLRKFRELSPLGRETVQSVTEALWACRQETSPPPAERPEGRIIPLYHTLAAVGCVSAVPGEDFDEISVTEQVPQTAEFARPHQRGRYDPLSGGRRGGVCEPHASAGGRCGYFQRERQGPLPAV